MASWLDTVIDHIATSFPQDRVSGDPAWDRPPLHIELVVSWVDGRLHLSVNGAQEVTAKNEGFHYRGDQLVCTWSARLEV